MRSSAAVPREFPALVMRRCFGATPRSGAFSHPGQLENHRSPARPPLDLRLENDDALHHADRRGIEGATPTRPIFPTTDSTSGTLAMARSCFAFTSIAGPRPVCGSSEGM